MTEFEKQEFWTALGRLYSTTLEQTKQIEAQGARIEALRDRTEALHVENEAQRQSVGALSESVGELFKVVSIHQESILALRDTAATHEKRLDRYEVTVEAMLDEIRKLRPGA